MTSLSRRWFGKLLFVLEHDFAALNHHSSGLEACNGPHSAFSPLDDLCRYFGKMTEVTNSIVYQKKCGAEIWLGTIRKLNNVDSLEFLTLLYEPLHQEDNMVADSNLGKVVKVGA